MKLAKERNRFSPPAEKQTRAWLAWLARGMQREGQTIFQIEQLQPSWLSTALQRWLYYPATRLLHGLMAGLIFGLVGGLTQASSHYVRGWGNTVFIMIAWWITPGMLAGLVSGIIEAARSLRNPPLTKRPARARLLRLIWSWLKLNSLFAFSFGLIFGPYLWLKIGPILQSEDFIYSLIACVFLVLFIGAMEGALPSLLWVRYRMDRNVASDIRSVESLRPGWRHVVGGLAIGAPFGGYLTLLWYQQLESERRGLNIHGDGLPPVAPVWAILAVALVAFAVGGLGGFVRPGVRELKTAPNEGIRLSWHNGLLMASLCSSTVVLLGPSLGWKLGTIEAAALAAYAFLWCGGLDAAQHYILRFLLWRAGVMPWRYAEFLDYAAEKLHLLQKVGGGYIFIHRYLLEHFAAMPTSQESLGPHLPAERPA